MSDFKVRDSEVSLLIAIATDLKPDEDNFEQWADSPFGWLKLGIPPARKGKISEEIVARYFAEKGFDVVKSPDREADRIIENVRVEIKFSTLWENGISKFQQLRDQNYNIAICLGISPFDAHCWVLPKETIMCNWGNVPGLGGQHGGSDATDTAWLEVCPTRVHDWLSPYGGTLSQAIEVFASLITKSPKPEPIIPARR
ncbi:MAG: hypothetical protein OXE95_11640 [Chloroflexi bacterium]|nr:hypothetical protein [Chloroflexota bacterium]MCY4248211.1 hypothetical protein [Chloroflexota bacterium]